MAEVRELLNNSIMSNQSFDANINAKDIVFQWLELLDQNKENIITINEIDVRNNNGFAIDYSVLEGMKHDILNIDDQYKKIISMQKDEKNNFIYGKEQDNIGTICLVYDGNTYAMIEFVAKCLLSHNALIILSESEYLKATNEIIIKLAQKVLESNKVNANLVQIYYTYDIASILSNNNSVAKAFVVGTREYQRKIASISRVPVVEIGYNNSEIYIEDSSNIEFVKNLINLKKYPIDLYVKEGIDSFEKDAIIVQDIDEAVTHINSSGSGYSSAIFTNNAEDGSMFLREIKSTFVSVNASPFVEQYNCLDINDLITIKNMYYPNPLKGDMKVEF